MKEITLIFLSTINCLRICEWFATNKIILGLCSITSLVGFVITISVSIKTKSIDKRLKEIRDIESFNKKRKKHATTIQTYQTSLYVDKTDIYKIKIDILNDLNIIYNTHKDIFSLWQKSVFWRTIKHLEKDKNINIEFICKMMSKLVAYMSINKED